MDVRRFEINAPAVIAETIDGEVMVMNLHAGIYYSVTAEGAHIWPALVAGVPVDVLEAGIVRATGAPRDGVAADLAVFVQRLLDESLLRPLSGTTGPPDPISPFDQPRESYRGFGFERFDDMRAMLVIDPVHEVGEFGWPQKAEPEGR
jgi:hypothetical protein